MATRKFLASPIRSVSWLTWMIGVATLSPVTGGVSLVNPGVIPKGASVSNFQVRNCCLLFFFSAETALEGTLNRSYL